MKGIKDTLNLIEASARLAVEARRQCESLLAAAFQSEADTMKAQLVFVQKRELHGHWRPA